MGTTAPKPLRKPRTKKTAPVKRLSSKERARVEEIFARFAAAAAHPKTELRYASPYTLVVAVALSAQATDVSVNKATERLYQVADTLAKMVELGDVGLEG